MCRLFVRGVKTELAALREPQNLEKAVSGAMRLESNVSDAGCGGQGSAGGVAVAKRGRVAGIG